MSAYTPTCRCFASWTEKKGRPESIDIRFGEYLAAVERIDDEQLTRVLTPGMGAMAWRTILRRRPNIDQEAPSRKLAEGAFEDIPPGENISEVAFDKCRHWHNSLTPHARWLHSQGKLIGKLDAPPVAELAGMLNNEFISQIVEEWLADKIGEDPGRWESLGALLQNREGGIGDLIDVLTDQTPRRRQTERESAPKGRFPHARGEGERCRDEVSQRGRAKEREIPHTLPIAPASHAVHRRRKHQPAPNADRGTETPCTSTATP